MMPRPLPRFLAPHALALGALTVTLHAQSAPPTWTLREDWRLRTGAIEILQIQGLTVTADGGILVAAGQDRQVLRFAPNGRHIFTTGREGRGPGEYTVPQLARPTGDSVWVYDILGRRLTVVGPNGRFVRSVDLTGGRKLPADGSPRSGRLTVGFIPVFVSSQVQDATTSVGRAARGRGDGRGARTSPHVSAGAGHTRPS